MLGPVEDEERPKRAHRMAQALPDRTQSTHQRIPACRVGRGQQAEEPRTGRIAHRLEVRVLVGVEHASDGDALRVVHVMLAAHYRQQHFRVGADEVAHARREAWQAVGTGAQLEQEGHRAEHPAGENHV